MDLLRPSSRQLPGDTSIGSVSLDVADLSRSLEFYADVIGMTVVRADSATAQLGFDAGPRLELTRVSGATPAPSAATGLYHMAILVPTRVALGRSLARLVERGYPLGGASDHLVSEALYLADPDGNGIEIYRDRPRDQWPTSDGAIRMDTLPLDLRALLDDAHAERRPWDGLATGTTFGHVHLQVDDLAAARRFYCDLIGFDVMVDLSRMGALFISAGGYHHHLGLNTWHSRGGARRPPGTAGLRSFSIVVPGRAALASIRERLEGAGARVEATPDLLAVDDSAGNRVVLSTGDAPASSQATTE